MEEKTNPSPPPKKEGHSPLARLGIAALRCAGRIAIRSLVPQKPAARHKTKAKPKPKTNAGGMILLEPCEKLPPIHYGKRQTQKKKTPPANFKKE